MTFRERSFRGRFSVESLCDVFESEVRKKSTVGIDRVTVKSFARDLRGNVEIISRKVLEGSYHFTNYSQMLVPKAPGAVPRELCIPTVRDKVTLKALSHVLDDAFGSLAATAQPQRTVDAIKECLLSGQYDAFFKFDIKGFYSSIDHELMLEALKRKISNDVLLALLMDAISTPSVRFGCSCKQKRLRGVPEGLPISNRLANIYLIELDKHFQQDDSIAFFRYVDDVLIFCKANDLERVSSEMSCFAKDMRLKLNEDKTKSGILSAEQFDYLGYRFRRDGLAVCMKARRRIEQSLELHLRLFEKMPRRQWLWRLNLRIAGWRVTEDGKAFQRYGWLYYYSRADDVAYFAKIDYILRKIAKRKGIALPSEVKSFKKAYYEIRYREGKTSYIPSFDYRMSLVDKRQILEGVFDLNDLQDKDAEEIDDLFRGVIRRELSILERDAGVIS